MFGVYLVKWKVVVIQNTHSMNFHRLNIIISHILTKYIQGINIDNVTFSTWK